MKKAQILKKAVRSGDDMPSEYQFDYRRAKPNRSASGGDPQRLVVALDSDVAEVFKTPESVNAILRALISTMPAMTRAKVRK